MVGTANFCVIVEVDTAAAIASSSFSSGGVMFIAIMLPGRFVVVVVNNVLRYCRLNPFDVAIAFARGARGCMECGKWSLLVVESPCSIVVFRVGPAFVHVGCGVVLFMVGRVIKAVVLLVEVKLVLL